MIHHSAHLWPGVPIALASAVLFGISAPVAKLLLGYGVEPWLMAGLLYLGSGIGLALVLAGRRILGVRSAEASLGRRDLPLLALVVFTGGVVAPVLLMLGLSVTTAATAALLLNFEGLATMVIAWVVLRENVDRRVLLGALAIPAGGLLLSWRGGPSGGIDWGGLAVMGACLLWGIDNNLTRRLSAADPVQIAMAKGLVAGAVNLAFAILVLASPLPGVGPMVGTSLLGFVSYGLSLVLFILAMRHLGTARSSAYFSIAPFIGAALAVAMLGESLSLQIVGAAALMALGLYLHVRERHEHEHAHEALEHEHRHSHDEHHIHMHDPADPPGEPHTHWHRHIPVRHRHPHYPELHHRHGHGR